MMMVANDSDCKMKKSAAMITAGQVSQFGFLLIFLIEWTPDYVDPILGRVKAGPHHDFAKFYRDPRGILSIFLSFFLVSLPRDEKRDINVFSSRYGVGTAQSENFMQTWHQ